MMLDPSSYIYFFQSINPHGSVARIIVQHTYGRWTHDDGQSDITLHAWTMVAYVPDKNNR